jgi:phosphatidylserine/phosphatidylglycerophosphate/cardiolipin synthase-like enzyme
VLVRDACDQLRNRLSYAEPAYLEGVLMGAIRAVERARRHQSVSVVWTGPESGVSSSRLTAATVIELINSAQSEILLVSYATHTEPSINAALAAAIARGVLVTLLAERYQDNPSYTASGMPFPGLGALRLHWPASARQPGASLHAKVIVVDDKVALVGSANLTNRAMESNLECGILIRGGPQPRAIRDHITGLYAAELLIRLTPLLSPRLSGLEQQLRFPRNAPPATRRSRFRPGSRTNTTQPAERRPPRSIGPQVPQMLGQVPQMLDSVRSLSASIVHRG